GCALFQDRLQHAVTRARRDNQSMAVLFLDLDHFKNVNDTLGHSVGDQLLRYVAQQMADQLRQCDTIARLGGDEFVVLLEQDVTPESLQVVVNKLLGLFVEPLQIAERSFYITASIGISRYPQDAQDADNLLKQADLAMYDAKRKGRNMAQHYQVALSADLLDRMSLENELRKAVRNNQLLLHYQPQFELDGEHLAGVEALVRWQHPELGMIPPSRFIPLAEEMGLISEIGDWVMQQACAQVAAWREQGFNVPRMAVNLSVQQIEHRDLASRVARLLNQYRLDAGQLELEVTESTLMGQHQHATQTLFDLEKLGVQLSIDDFGTGYSSLSYLKRLPVHRLKIDRSFVLDIGRDPNDEAIVRAVIALGNSMSLQLLAEGVERPEQADFLRREGCHLVQGYWYGKPLTADEIYQRFGPPAAK
ncbi:MAG: putative bifunctional diguanylate cyclase/phosphodiesterase, partial [Burkholderiales bacterium]